MAKKVIDDFNVSYRVRKAIERGAGVAELLELQEITTLSVIVAMLFEEKSCLNDLYQEYGLREYGKNDEDEESGKTIAVLPNYLLDSLLQRKEIYERITGKTYPEGIAKLSPEPSIKIGVEEDPSGNAIEVSVDDLEVVEKSDEENKSEIVTKEMDVNQFLDYLASAMVDGMEGYDQDYFDSIELPYSKALNDCIIDAGIRCRECGQEYIDDENLLYSILNYPEDCSAKRLLEEINSSFNSSNLGFTVDIIDLIDILCESENIHLPITDAVKKVTIPKQLENCCEILNYKYEKGCKCDILGRDDEIFATWSILSKKQKGNAILLGEPGVGKSAVVEAMTMQIVNGDCPERFKDYLIVELNITGMVAGTKYRGEFEKKIEYLTKFINTNDNVIIFVDEVHQIMGAGSAEGSGPDLSGSLKPILARDKVKFIGATTMKEYEQYICRDGAFKRRLEPVEIKEPKESKVLEMLKVKIDNLKKHHSVKCDDTVLDYIQLLAACFNIEVCNPDRTLDLIDKSLAIAESKGAKKVLRSHVELAYKANFDKFNKLSKEYKTSTAYHEAGHFVAHMLLKDKLVDSEVYAISIVPGFDFMGVNIIEDTEQYAEGVKSFYEARIATKLAGRIGEALYTNTISSGASNDYGHATAIAKRMILNCAMSETEGFSNISLYDRETGNDLPLTEKQIEAVTKEAKKTLDKVYKETEELLTKNKDKVVFIAKELLKKKVIKASDYYYLFEEK